MKNLIVIGTGVALTKHYAAPLQSQQSWRIKGFVEAREAAWPEKEIFPEAWRAHDIKGVTKFDATDTLLILTPDHYVVIEECARLGYRQFIVEKPLVSRDNEIEKLSQCIAQYNLKIYAIDFYIQKLFVLYRALGVIGPDDPRAEFIASSLPIIPGLFGVIEGVAVTIVEGGDFCLPDLEKRPWLEHDADIGGMLRDLGTHALAPLLAARLLTPNARVHDVHFAKLAPSRDTLVPTKAGDVEMHINVLLSGLGNVPVTATFGKVPLAGGIWTIAIRTKKGHFYGSLRSGQDAVFVGNDGVVNPFMLTHDAISVVLQEASMYFDGLLGSHDGYVQTLLDALTLLARIRKKY